MSTAELLAQLGSAPLAQLLQQALRLAQRHSDATFEHWIRLELLGYFNSNSAMKETDTVPEYRTVGGEHYDEFGRPLHITDPNLSFVNETRVRWGVADLEELFRQGGQVTLRDLTMSNLLYRHLRISVTWFSFDSRQLAGVLAAIRAQLADYLLKYDHHPLASAVADQPKLAEEIIELKPNLWGIGINLRALSRRISDWWTSRRERKKDLPL